MKKMILIAVACAFIAAPASADPYYFNFLDLDGGLYGYGNSTLISPYAIAPGSLVETFNRVNPLPTSPISTAAGLDQAGWTWGPGGGGTGENGAVVTGNKDNYYSAPWSHYTNAKDATPYATVPYDKSTSAPRQTAVSFGDSYSYLGLHWGSMDPPTGTWSQQILLYDGGIGGTLVATVVAPIPASGAQTQADTNRYVNIFLTEGKVFDTAVFQSNEFAFEFDNLAVGTVPVPGAVLLGLLGLGASGLKLRRFA